MSAAGTWKLAMQTPIGERKVTLTIEVAGASLTGKMSAEDGNAVDIAAQSAKEGIWDLRRSGLSKVKAGITSLDEVNQCTTE